MLGRPLGLSRWVGPVVAALIGLATTAIDIGNARNALIDLAPALAFLVFAVLLAVGLDELGLGLLPVSNLTNLIVATQVNLGVEEFVAVMSLPTLLACTIGFVAYRWTFRQASQRVAQLASSPNEARPLPRCVRRRNASCSCTTQ